MRSNKSSENPLKIIILGGGTAGWMAANIFVRKWSDKNVNVTLVESPDVGIIGVGEGSTPTLKRFFESIDVAESEWMPKCNATYKLSIRFDDWSPKSRIKSYAHPFTSQVDVHTSRAFLTNSRTRRLGLDTNTTPEDFLINGVLAKQGKGPITPENFPFIMEYGYHFDSHLLGNYLKELGKSRGVNYQQAHIDSVNRTENGNIGSIVTREGKSMSADLFVDCTGFASKLMQEALSVPFISFKDNLFNDSAVVMQTPIGETIPPETVSTALTNGWCWKIPLSNRFGNGYVYSSDHITEDEAETEFRRHIGMTESEQSCRHLKMKVGQIGQHWFKNCVAIGLSQGFIEPLEATALHLVQISIESFVSKFEEGGFTNKHQDDYNQAVKFRFERVRDYIVAHYKMNTRDDSGYWRDNRDNTKLSNSLIQLLDVWFKRGDLSQEIARQGLNNHFDAVSWNCLLSGYGAFPSIAKEQPGKGDLYIENGIQGFLMGCSLNFNSHKANLVNLKN